MQGMFLGHGCHRLFQTFIPSVYLKEKGQRVTSWIVASALLAVTFSTVNAAKFEKALAAYERGEYVEARREFRIGFGRMHNER